MKISDMGEIIENIVSNIASLTDISAGMQENGQEADRIIRELSDSNDKTVEAVQSVAKTVEATDESVKKISEADDYKRGRTDQSALPQCVHRGG